MFLSCHVRVFRVNPHSRIAWMLRKSLLGTGPDMLSLSYCSGIRTHNHLVYKGTPKHLTKPVKWLSCVVRTYLYDGFDCMLLLCHVRDCRVNPHSIVATL